MKTQCEVVFEVRDAVLTLNISGLGSRWRHVITAITSEAARLLQANKWAVRAQYQDDSGTWKSQDLNHSAWDAQTERAHRNTMLRCVGAPTIGANIIRNIDKLLRYLKKNYASLRMTYASLKAKYEGISKVSTTTVWAFNRVLGIVFKGRWDWNYKDPENTIIERIKLSSSASKISYVITEDFESRLQKVFPLDEQSSEFIKLLCTSGNIVYIYLVFPRIGDFEDTGN